MILVHIEKFSCSAYSLLKRRDRHALEKCESTLPWGYVRLQGIGRRAKETEDALIKGQLDDTSIQVGEYKLCRALIAPNEAYLGGNDFRLRLFDLIGAFYHQQGKPEKIDIVELSEFIQMFLDAMGYFTTGRLLPGLFGTYDGSIVFAYFAAGRLKFEPIEETSVIERMKLTKVSDLISEARAQAERQHADNIRSIDEAEKACTDRSFDVVKKLLGSDILNHARGA